MKSWDQVRQRRSTKRQSALSTDSDDESIPSSTAQQKGDINGLEHFIRKYPFEHHQADEANKEQEANQVQKTIPVPIHSHRQEEEEQKVPRQTFGHYKLNPSVAAAARWMGPVDPAVTRAELVRVFTVHKPAKLTDGTIDGLLHHFEGNERGLLEVLYQKYHIRTCTSSSSFEQVQSQRTKAHAQCSRCRKWRSIPAHMEELLPKIWRCSMNLWDAGHSRCETPEEFFLDLESSDDEEEAVDNEEEDDDADNDSLPVDNAAPPLVSMVPQLLPVAILQSTPIMRSCASIYPSVLAALGFTNPTKGTSEEPDSDDNDDRALNRYHHQSIVLFRSIVRAKMKQHGWTQKTLGREINESLTHG
jgi:hypothetical protein